jgi:hypothetical protein
MLEVFFMPHHMHWHQHVNYGDNKCYNHIKGNNDMLGQCCTVTKCHTETMWANNNLSSHLYNNVTMPLKLQLPRTYFNNDLGFHCCKNAFRNYLTLHCCLTMSSNNDLSSYCCDNKLQYWCTVMWAAQFPGKCDRQRDRQTWIDLDWTTKHRTESHYIGIFMLKCMLLIFNTMQYLCDILKHSYFNLTILCNNEISGTHGGKY